ncbi:MAG: AAA family ATPase [Frankiaceae bacterium]
MRHQARGAFVGRSAELAALRALLERAGDGRPGIALVGGDAGVGKSRLVGELITHARLADWAVLAGQCADIGEGLPYLPFADALRAAADDPETATALLAAAEARPWLRPLLPVPGESATLLGTGPEIEQLQLFGAVLEALAALAVDRPLLLVLEDLHWADRSSRDLFTFLCRTLRHERIAVVATYRADDLHRRHPLRPLLAELARLPEIERIDLAPFDDDELHSYLAQLAPTLPPDVLASVAARSEGNAFYAEELVDAADKCRTGLPTGLADLLLARVEQLSEQTQDVLRAAAVAGRRVDHRLLLLVTGMAEPQIEDALREALAHQVLVPSGADAFVFRHALLQEATYTDLLPGQRTRLHGRYAAALAEQRELGSSAELAHHCLAAHDIPGAFAASVRAGHEAKHAAAPAEALAHYERALSLYDRVPDAAATAGMTRERLAIIAAAMAAAAGEHGRAVAIARGLHAAVDPAADPLLAAEVAERLAMHLLDVDLDLEAVEPARQALELVPPEPPTRLRARVLAAWARVLLSNRRDDEAPAVAAEAIDAAQRAGSPDDEADALGSLALVAERLGDDARAVELLDRAHELARDGGNLPVELRVGYHLARVHYQVGALDEAARRADDAIRRAQQAGVQWSAFGVNVLILQYLVRYLAGDWDDAEQLAAAYDLRVSTVTSAIAAAVAAQVQVARGDPTVEARLELARRFEDADLNIGYLAGTMRAELALWQGDTQRARAQLRETMHMLRTRWHPYTLATVRVAALALAATAADAGAARRRGDEPALQACLDEGQELLDQARQAVATGGGSGGAVGAEGRAWLARAEAERSRLTGEDDPKAWIAAAEAFGFGDPYEAARCRWRLTEALLAHGEREAAGQAWAEAHETARQLRAGPLLAALDDLRRRGRLGGDIAVQPVTTEHADLTSREVEVLALVASGLSNKQVGERLFISTKTASVHVSNILAKLGATSRTEAAAIAHREGLLDSELRR